MNAQHRNCPILRAWWPIIIINNHWRMRCKIQAVTQNHFHSWVLWSINFIIRENVKMSKNTCMPSRRRSHGDWWGTIWSYDHIISSLCKQETHNWYETFYNNYQYDSKLIWFNMSLLSMIKWTCGSRHLLVGRDRCSGPWVAKCGSFFFEFCTTDL